MIHRSHPQFSLCGLNCALCPRYNTVGPSRCPGCGALEFSEFHPTCAIMTCNNKKEQAAFCFQCSGYPCARYQGDDRDSFITYVNRLRDLQQARSDLDGYLQNLEEKTRILRHLLEGYDDGRSKNFFCLAVNLLETDDLLEVLGVLTKSSDTKAVRQLLFTMAQKRGISITLRK